MNNLMISQEIFKEKTMTFEDIAHLCSKNKSTIQRWAQNAMQNASNNAMQNASNISQKISNSTKTNPARFTMEEVIDIIRHGGCNELLANLLQENANQEIKLKTLLTSLKTQAEAIIGAITTKAITELTNEIKEQKKQIYELSIKNEMTYSTLIQIYNSFTKAGIFTFFEKQNQIRRENLCKCMDESYKQQPDVFEALELLPIVINKLSPENIRLKAIEHQNTLRLRSLIPELERFIQQMKEKYELK